MGAPDILARLAAAGISLKPLPDGRLWAAPRAALTDELRELVRENRAELLMALSKLAAEGRRLRVLRMLADHPEATYAVVTDTEAVPGFVVVVVAIRGKATCELHIPREKYDGTLLLDLIERHWGTVH